MLIIENYIIIETSQWMANFGHVKTSFSVGRTGGNKEMKERTIRPP